MKMMCTPLKLSKDHLGIVKKIFSRRFKEIRIERGYTQSHLARVLNVSRSCLCSWEYGKTMPNINTLVLICNTLNISCDYLAGLTSYKIPFSDEHVILESNNAKYLNISRLTDKSTYQLIDYYHNLLYIQNKSR